MKLAARVIVLVVALLVVCGGSTSAHPLGNFTVNHYVGLDIRGDGLSIDYVLDLAEIPAFQLRGAIAPDPSAACAVLSRDLGVALDGAALAIRVGTGTVSFPPGQAGLDTLRLECTFRALWTLGTTPHRLAGDHGSGGRCHDRYRPSGRQPLGPPDRVPTRCLQLVTRCADGGSAYLGRCFE